MSPNPASADVKVPGRTVEGSVAVLLVDDDTALRRSLRLGLERAGYAVTEAADGNEALERVAERSFDWVVTDIVMPNREGIELVQVLRQRHPCPRIVAISGGGIGSAAEYLQVARLLGAEYGLAKPFPYTDLVALLQSGPGPRRG